MGISIVKYSANEGHVASWGVLREGSIFEVGLDLADHVALMRLYFGNRSEFIAAVSSSGVPVSDACLHAPISKNIQLFCQGLNYTDHRKEGGVEHKTQGQNLIFMKAVSSVCSPNDPIIRPKGCELLDYEIELGIVLKSDIFEPTHVSDADLKSLIGGIVMANDVSSRDDQFGATAMQWFKGKSYRGFCPMGPVLYLLDEDDFDQLDKLQLTLKMNGEVKQSATTDLLIHKPAATLSEISSFSDIRAGDCVLTGTPGGVLLNMNLKSKLSVLLNMTNDEKRRAKFVAAQRAQAKFLQSGDVLELEIKSLDRRIDLGTQKNEIIDA